MASSATPGRRRRLSRRLTLAERYYERALHAYGRSRHDAAIADLDEAIQAEPKRAELYIARGLALLADQRADDAEEDFAYGLALDPTQWGAHYGRGLRDFEAGDYRAAVDAFSRAQHLAQDRFEIYVYRAISLHQLGQTDEALRDLRFAETLIEASDKRFRLLKRWIDTMEAAAKPVDKDAP
ncbi:MAG: tetratricopeptide repeat protein [Chloroflexi bacterium]|nr:tetratricopeptide repeat protein [Chloroflexota bacterium]